MHQLQYYNSSQMYFLGCKLNSSLAEHNLQADNSVQHNVSCSNNSQCRHQQPALLLQRLPFCFHLSQPHRHQLQNQSNHNRFHHRHLSIWTIRPMCNSSTMEIIRNHMKVMCYSNETKINHAKWSKYEESLSEHRTRRKSIKSAHLSLWAMVQLWMTKISTATQTSCMTVWPNSEQMISKIISHGRELKTKLKSMIVKQPKVKWMPFSLCAHHAKMNHSMEPSRLHGKRQKFNQKMR